MNHDSAEKTSDFFNSLLGALLCVRAIAALGHEVKLIAPGYVKQFVKRQKNDMTDAEATAEAVLRPTMHLMTPKTEAQRASEMVFRTRDLLVRQRNRGD